jgi:hypothetical protein
MLRALLMFSQLTLPPGEGAGSYQHRIQGMEAPGGRRVFKFPEAAVKDYYSPVAESNRKLFPHSSEGPTSVSRFPKIKVLGGHASSRGSGVVCP